jgi:hypothetical protein
MNIVRIKVKKMMMKEMMIIDGYAKGGNIGLERDQTI